MTEKEQSNDTKKEEQPATPQPTELKTKWVTDSANKEIKGTILNEDKKK